MKKLRKIYNQDPAAKKFLEDHPEFDDRFLEQSEVNNPGFDTAKGRYSLHEPGEDQKEYGNNMLEAVNLMPGGPAKTLLELYYHKGLTVTELQRLYGASNRNVIDLRIKRAKRAALKALSARPRVLLLNQTPLETKVFVKGSEVRFVYLVCDELTKENLWVDDKGRAYPTEIQAILDEAPEYADWDEVYL